MQEQGFTGGYTRVTEYVRRWREDGGKLAKTAFIPLKFEFGVTSGYTPGVRILSAQRQFMGGFREDIKGDRARLAKSARRAASITA